MRCFRTLSCSANVRARHCALALVPVLATACADPMLPDGGGPRGGDDASEDSEGDGTPHDTDEACASLPMFLLAGQSNMEGNVDTALFTSLLDELGKGSNDDLEARMLAALRSWYFEANDGYASYGYTDAMAELEIDQLIAYRDQGWMGPDLTAPHAETYCSFNDAPVAPLAASCGHPFGPELMLGHVWATSGQPTTSLVKVARGGTTLFTDWRSPASGGEVGPDYLLLQKKIAALATDPASVHPTCAEDACRWAAFIWFQGENDSLEESHASAYEDNLRNLLADVRAEVGDPALPVIVVQTGAWAQSLGFGADVAAAQQRVVDEDAHAQLVETYDLSGFYHYDPAAQLIIGRRIADAVETELGCD